MAKTYIRMCSTEDFLESGIDRRNHFGLKKLRRWSSLKGPSREDDSYMMKGVAECPKFLEIAQTQQAMYWKR